ALSHPQSFVLDENPLDFNKPDSLMNLTEKVVKGMMEEQYPLDRRSPILFPPNVVGKEIKIQATVSKGDEALEGVIVAQGGKANGYSLFIQNNALIWLVKQDGRSYQASTR